jgi:diacylglycerol kinase (ATP)
MLDCTGLWASSPGGTIFGGSIFITKPGNLSGSQFVGKPGNRGLTRIINAFVFSAKGLRAGWKHEEAFRQELILALVLLPLSFYISVSATQLALLLMTLFIVLITEILNSAIEAVVDRVSDEHHQLAGRAKDMGSAAVFLSLMMTVVIWVVIIHENFF